MHRAKSFEEADAFDKRYYRQMSPEKRLEAVQFLREMAARFQRRQKRANRKRLRRVITIIQQT